MSLWKGLWKGRLDGLGRLWGVGGVEEWPRGACGEQLGFCRPAWGGLVLALKVSCFRFKTIFAC